MGVGPGRVLLVGVQLVGGDTGVHGRVVVEIPGENEMVGPDGVSLDCESGFRWPHFDTCLYRERKRAEPRTWQPRTPGLGGDWG